MNFFLTMVIAILAICVGVIIGRMGRTYDTSMFEFDDSYHDSEKEIPK